MSDYNLTINLGMSYFPEIGSPLGIMSDVVSFDDIKKKDSTLKTMRGSDGKEEFKVLKSVLNSVKSSFRPSMELVGASFSNNKVSLDYSEGKVQTYKFLGMDIDKDYNAIIPMGDGYVVTMSMFDRDKVIEALKTIGSKTEDVSHRSESYIKTCSMDVVRKMSTAIKTGIFFDGDTRKSVTPETLEPLYSDMIEELRSKSPEVNLPYDSIILNLINKKTLEDARLKSSMTPEDTIREIAISVASAIIIYWTKVTENYNHVYNIIAALDLWSDTYKKFVGDDIYLNRLKKAQDLTSNLTGEVLPYNVSYNGVSRSGDIQDNNIFRNSASNAMEEVLNKFKQYTGTIDTKSILLGCIDTDMFENPYSLTESQLQAVSDYDALQMIDEDVSLSVKSYNMDDEDERALFLRSAKKSYDRNFRQYKPSNQYNVTEAMASMLEDGEKFEKKIIPDGAENDDNAYVVTDTLEKIKLDFKKNDFIKVGKIVNKVTSDILGMF